MASTRRLTLLKRKSDIPQYVSCSLNSLQRIIEFRAKGLGFRVGSKVLKGDYIGDYEGDYYRGNSGGCIEFRL